MPSANTRHRAYPELLKKGSKIDQKWVEKRSFGRSWGSLGGILGPFWIQGGPSGAQARKRSEKVSYSPPEPGPKIDKFRSKIVKWVILAHFVVDLGAGPIFRCKMDLNRWSWDKQNGAKP